MNKMLLGALAVFGLTMVSACSDTDETPEPPPPGANVKVTANQFTPAQVKIKVGESVRWTWGGGTHNVVSGSNCTDDGKFTSGAPMGGGTFDHKFETAGTFPYFCSPHCTMGMVGEVIVEP
jgi:plastocyanin